MDIFKFSDWVKTEFDFDCFQNDFFKKTLMLCKEEFENSTYDGVPFEEHYQNNLNAMFLKSYHSQLKFLLKSIPKPPSELSLTIAGIDLNSYSNHIDELQFLIQKLDS